MARTITGSLVKADTSPIADIRIYFRPLAVVAYTTASDMIDLTPVETVTDSLGAFTTTLYTTEDFDTSSSNFVYSNMGYRIEIPSLGIVRLVTVPDGTSSIDWNQLGTDID
jgi:hypothetical protein